MPFFEATSFTVLKPNTFFSRSAALPCKKAISGVGHKMSDNVNHLAQIRQKLKKVNQKSGYAV